MNHSPSKEHEKGREIWRRATVAPNASNAEYYDRQERALRELLTQVGPGDSALDIGCGEGRFSFVIGETFSRVLGVDISSAMINDANATVASRGVSNIAFRAIDVEEGLPAGPFDLIGCMGVFTTIIDKAPYRDLMKAIYKRLAPGGYLISKDTTTTDGNGEIKLTEKSVRNYRCRDRYELDIAEAGFDLVERTELLASARHVNNLYLWRCKK